jgi:hypothetical protein
VIPEHGDELTEDELIGFGILLLTARWILPDSPPARPHAGVGQTGRRGRTSGRRRPAAAGPGEPSRRRCRAGCAAASRVAVGRGSVKASPSGAAAGSARWWSRGNGTTASGTPADTGLALAESLPSPGAARKQRRPMCFRWSTGALLFRVSRRSAGALRRQSANVARTGWPTPWCAVSVRPLPGFSRRPGGPVRPAPARRVPAGLRGRG